MSMVVDGGTIERHGAALNWGLAGSPLVPESASGDLCAVWSPAEGALIAVVDGSGHGAEAAAAAQLARRVIDDHPRESPVALILRCHERLRGTRGAAMTLASVNLADRTITWLGIGLPGSRRLMDEFEITSQVGKGTTVTMRKFVS